MAPPETTRHAFKLAYRKLEERMEALADADGDVFLPNPPPVGPADYVLICMEPSLGHWAPSADRAREQVARGFRTFLSSIEDFILHFCARTYLCRPAQRYHITDLSKGAMLVDVARPARVRRYERWYPLLSEEIELVAAPNARFVAVGTAVARELRRQGFRRPLLSVIHYSGQAARARSLCIASRASSFEAFKGTVSLQDLLLTAEEVLRSARVPAAIRDSTLARLGRSHLTISSKQLIFNYKVAFELLRSLSP